MLSFSQATFVYEPYPICWIGNVFSDAEYDALTRSYPDLGLFDHKPKLGDKYSLSERNNPDNYRRFVEGSPPWAKLHAHVKSARFIDGTFGFLKQHNIDLGLGRYDVNLTRWRKKKSSWRSRLSQRAELNVRFEFSVMGGQGGHILPHTDDPVKLVTLVMSMIRPGEWNDAWGGGTQVCMPKDRTLIYNQLNRFLDFEQVDVLGSYDFRPNQCILFIKTYNSWHQVAPINAPVGAPLRRTLTINIERLG